MTGLGGVDVAAADAETGASLDQITAFLRAPWLTDWKRTKAGETKVALAGVPAGGYDLLVSAKGYCATPILTVEVKAGERRAMNVKLKRGGQLALTLVSTRPASERSYPLIILVMKRSPVEAVPFRELASQTLPGVGLMGFPTEGAPSTELDGLAAGDYSAILYYYPKQQGGDPETQCEIRFRIEAGKTTELSLKEADFQPYVPPQEKPADAPKP